MRLKNSVISSILTYACVTFIFFFVGVLCGNLSMFQGDDFQQYLVFITDFIRILRGGGSVWYSFSNYLGSGNILTIAYYCLSPFNILFLVCGDHIYVAYFLIVSFKISLASATFYLFISRMTKKDRFYHIIASLFYALSGFVVTWYFDIMWLDAVYILPVLITFIIMYIEKGSYIFLVIIYSYLFITNFYMGYIVGVFSALFFVLYLLFFKNYRFKGNVLFYLKRGLGYAGVVILSIGICSGLLLSVAGFLSEHMAHDNIEFSSLVASLLDIVNSMFIGEFQTMDNRVPVLYAGLPTMALTFFFFIKKDVNIKDKVFWGIQILFYVVGMLYLPLYKFLHAFDYPNFYGYRFSFVVVFLLISVSCYALDNLEEKSIDFFKWFIVAATVFYSFMMTFQNIYFAGQRLNNQVGLIVNAVFFVLWFAIIYIRKTKLQKDSKMFSIATISIAIAELIINGYICISNTDFVHLEKNLINGWYYSEREAVEKIEASDDGFYRVYVNNEVNANAGKMFGFNGLNTFSSADNYTLRMALCRLGESTSNRYMRSNCSVPVFDSLFAVNYYVNMPESDDYMYVDVNENNYESALIANNEYPLSLGYMVSSDILNYNMTNNAFDNLDNLCSAMIGEECDIFENIILDTDDYVLMNYKMEEINGRLYFDRTTSLYDGEAGLAIMLDDYSDNRYLEFSYNSPGSYDGFPTVYTDENGAYHSKLLAEGGVYKMGKADEYNYIKTVFVGANSPSFYINSINVAEYHKEVYEKVYDEISSNQYNVVVNDSDYISGTVVATESKPYLFTTIPYDPEWHIYVDGEPITKLYRVVGDAFMVIELTPGEHTVAFEYVEKWSNEGAIISLSSITIYLGLILYCILKKKTDDLETNFKTEEVEIDEERE